jgi:hypothetical protein
MSSKPEHTSHSPALGASLEQAETFEDFPNEADSNDVPSGYWRSYRFIGSLLAIVLLANGLFIGYVMPVGLQRIHIRKILLIQTQVNVLSVINEDIGMHKHIASTSGSVNAKFRS